MLLRWTVIGHIQKNARFIWLLVVNVTDFCIHRPQRRRICVWKQIQPQVRHDPYSRLGNHELPFWVTRAWILYPDTESWLQDIDPGFKTGRVMTRVILAPDYALTPSDLRTQTFRVNVEWSTYYCELPRIKISQADSSPCIFKSLLSPFFTHKNWKFWYRWKEETQDFYLKRSHAQLLTKKIFRDARGLAPLIFPK